MCSTSAPTMISLKRCSSSSLISRAAALTMTALLCWATTMRLLMMHTWQAFRSLKSWNFAKWTRLWSHPAKTIRTKNHRKNSQMNCSTKPSSLRTNRLLWKVTTSIRWCSISLALAEFTTSSPPSTNSTWLTWLKNLSLLRRCTWHSLQAWFRHWVWNRFPSFSVITVTSTRTKTLTTVASWSSSLWTRKQFQIASLRPSSRLSCPTRRSELSPAACTKLHLGSKLTTNTIGSEKEKKDRVEETVCETRLEWKARLRGPIKDAQSFPF